MPLAPPPPHALPPPARTSPRIACACMCMCCACAPPSTLQFASYFNGDISSWDTSKVTDMSGMFGVRSTRALTPNSLESGLPPVHAACAAAAPHTLPPPGLHLAPHRMPLPSTRQRTNTFNQPLSFDTSKVTTMKDMFHVRSARALTPSRHGSGLPPCMPLAPPPPHALPPPGAHLAPLRMCPSLRLGSSRTGSTSH